MNEETSNEGKAPAENDEFVNRRLFLRSLGKWSGAVTLAAVTGGVFIASCVSAGWINRRGVVGGGGWINGRGGWVNRAGGWINGRGGGGGWVNRRGGGGGGWINRW